MSTQALLLRYWTVRSIFLADEAGASIRREILKEVIIQREAIITAIR